MLNWLLGRVLGLGPASKVTLAKDAGVRTPMRDGVELVADRYYPAADSAAPLILIRSPYGRSSMFGKIAGLLVARGFQVVIQCVRGTMDSGGRFDPMRQEQADGADTVNWVRAQPWCPEQLFTFGISYLGNAQWALAEEAGDRVDGYGMAMTLSNFRDELLAFGGLTQGGMLGWSMLMRNMVDWAPGQKMQRPRPEALKTVENHLPLGTIDQAAFGQTLDWWQDWIAHPDPEDPWWQAIDHSGAVARVAEPVSMVAGWQDIFLPFQLQDFKARQAAGKPTWLTIGPWHHSSLKGMAAGLRESLALFSALRDKAPPFPDRQAVRLYLQGANRWCEFPAWPPSGGSELQLFLRAGGRLAGERPAAGEGGSRYVYDPADPTPSLHGPSAMGASRVRAMAALESREDTLLFTSDPFTAAVAVVGEVAVDLAVRSDCEHTDFFVCLCDVDRKGKSIQVSDGYLRLRPGRPQSGADGVRRITINCWPTAYQFAPGHRLRLIVASGAHPRFSRNLGRGEAEATATAMRVAAQEVLHDASDPSVLRVTTLDPA